MPLPVRQALIRGAGEQAGIVRGKGKEVSKRVPVGSIILGVYSTMFPPLSSWPQHASVATPSAQHGLYHTHMQCQRACAQRMQRGQRGQACAHACVRASSECMHASSCSGSSITPSSGTGSARQEGAGVGMIVGVVVCARAHHHHARPHARAAPHAAPHAALPPPMHHQ